MKNNCYLIGLILIVSSLYSCDSYVPLAYQVTAPTVSLLEQQGDFELMGAIGSNHFEVQSAVSPFKHAALMGNLYLGSGSNFSHNFGIGTYVNVHPSVLLEVYGLTGTASHNETVTKEFTPLLASNNYKNIHTSNYSYKYNSVQFNLGFKASDRGSYFFSTRYTRTRNHSFNYLRSEYSDQGSSGWSLLETSEQHYTGAMDMLNFSVGYSFWAGKMKGKIQLTSFKRIELSDKPDMSEIYFKPLLVSAVVGWDFDNPRKRPATPKVPSTP